MAPLKLRCCRTLLWSRSREIDVLVMASTSEVNTGFVDQRTSEMEFFLVLHAHVALQQDAVWLGLAVLKLFLISGFSVL
jgi:hypothetical protein